MANVTKQVCDYCRSEANVQKAFITRETTVEVDVCDKCWKAQWSALLKPARPSRAKRPSTRFVKTVLPPQP